MSFTRAVWLIAAKDLRLEMRTWHSLAVMFALAVALIFAFAFTLGQSAITRLGPERLVPATLWVSLVFASLVGFRNSFALEREREAIAGLLLAPVDRSAVFLGKLAANLASVLLLEAAVVPLTALFFGYDLSSVAPGLAAVLLLHTFGLCALGTFMGGLTARLRRGEALLAILTLPPAVPLLISAGRSTSAAIAGRPLSEVRFWLALAAVFGAVLCSLGTLVFEILLEE